MIINDHIVAVEVMVSEGLPPEKSLDIFFYFRLDLFVMPVLHDLGEVIGGLDLLCKVMDVFAFELLG